VRHNDLNPGFVAALEDFASLEYKEHTGKVFVAPVLQQIRILAA